MENRNIKEILKHFKSGDFNMAEKKAAILVKKFPNNYLYNNKKVLKEFEKFLENAHKAVQQGKKIKNSYVFKN